MTIRHLASAGCSIGIVIASVAAFGQQKDQSAAPGPKAPAESAVTGTSPGSSALPSRRVETRSESADGELRTETVETPDADGRLKPSGETITQTIRPTPNVTRTKRDVVAYFGPGQRTLLETIESEQEVLADGSSRTVESTWAPDSSGRLGLTSRRVQQTKSLALGVKQTDTTVFRRGTDALQESERIQQTERQVAPDLRRIASTRAVRDMNGRFQLTEERSQEVRTIGPSQQEEETVQRLDADGKLSLSERNVTRRSGANGQDQTVTEIFSRDLGGGLMRSDNRLELSQRLRRTTTTAADGGRQTIEELEARKPTSPNEPMQMVQRIVETTRKVSGDRWQTERQVFVRDVNGRWVLATAETGGQTER